MSEQILERTAAVVDSAPEPARSRRTFVVVAMAIIAGLVLGGAALFLFGPGGADEELAAAPAAGSQSGSSAGSVEQPAEQPVAQPVAKKSTAKVSSRDPFAPLVTKPEPAPAPKAKSKAKSTAKAKTPAQSSASSSGTRPATGATLTVVSIADEQDSLTLKLDGTKYTVEEGEAFAKDYRLYDIFNSDCAGFLYGDQNAVVCRGDQVKVG